MHFILDTIDAVRVTETGIFTLGGCELVVQMAPATSEYFDASAGMSNSMSSNDTSSLDVTQVEHTEPRRSLDVQSVPVKQPPQPCQDRNQHLSAQTQANADSIDESNHSTNFTGDPLLGGISKLSLEGEQQSFNAAKCDAQQKMVEYNTGNYVQPLTGTDDSVAHRHHGVSPPRIMGDGSQKEHSFQTTTHDTGQRSFSSPQSAPEKMISKEEKEEKDQNVVEAIDIPQGTHKQMLTLVFSSKKESGGGEIKALYYDKGAGCARITYNRREGR